MDHQQLKYECLAVVALLKIMYGLDNGFGAHKNPKIVKTMDFQKSLFITLWRINGQQLFAILSSSMINHVARFDPIAIWGPVERLNSSDLAKGAQDVQIYWSNSLDFFINISRYMRDQRLIFDIRAVLSLLKMVNGSNHDCGDP